jgi:hypothetical protein
LPPRRNVDLQAMRLMGFGVADYSQRSTQHKRNAEFFVSRCVGMEVDKFYATPEALKNMGVAALRIFWRVNGNFFCLEIQKLG